MRPEAECVLNLLAEIDEICSKYDIEYFCGGVFPRIVANKRDSVIEKGVIYAKVEDIGFLVEVLSKEVTEKREIEFANGYNNYPSFSARFIDTNTLFIDERTIGLCEKPGIHIEMIPILHCSSQAFFNDTGLYYGEKRIGQHDFFGALKKFSDTNTKELGKYYIQDATGSIKEIDLEIINDITDYKYCNQTIRLPRKIDAFNDVLYRKADGSVSVPSLPQSSKISSASISYKDFFVEAEIFDEEAKIIEEKLSVIDKLTEKIEKRDKIIRGVLREVKGLYD